MSSTAPFRYPSGNHRFRHGPNGYERYSSYRPWLRDEFDYRCVYCLFRERWCPILQFHLDHFVARVDDETQVTSYRNLVYACPTCNCRKSSRRLPSPLKAMNADSVTVNEDGTIVANTKVARRLIRVLGLDSAEYNEWRRLMIDIVAMAAQIRRGSRRTLYFELMGYPIDLPNLSNLGPPSNSRPAGIVESAFARRSRGELPKEY